MTTTSISPNMGLVVPTVGVDPGPDWANNINADLSIIDQHNHTSGQGVAIPSDGININADLPFNSNNATVLRSSRFAPQASPLSVSSDVGCLYESGVDLYYNDGNGNQVRITQGGSVTGASGTITGLPSGTASASYSTGTFTFQSATSTPALLAVGPIKLGNNVVSSKTITIAPNSGIASNYNLTLPAAVPATLNYVTLDNSGNLSYNTSGVTGSGAVVLATSPALTTPTMTTTTISAAAGASPLLTINTSTAATNSDYIITRWQKSSSNVWDVAIDNSIGNSTGVAGSFYINSYGSGGVSLYITPAGAVIANHGFIASSVTATTLTGNGSAITNLNMANASSGTLAVVRGGTGTTTSTGTGSVVLSNAPTLNTPIIGGSGIVFPSGTMVDFAQGTWSPSFTSLSGASAVSLSGSARYVRIGQYVQGWFVLNVTASTTGSVQFNFSLPISPVGNFADATQCIGIVSDGLNDKPGSIQSSTSTKLGLAQVVNIGSTGGTLWNCSFMYIVNT